MEKIKYLVELSDNEYRLYTKAGLERIEARCLEYDGIIPYRVVGRCDKLTVNKSK